MRLYKRSTKPSRWTQFTNAWNILMKDEKITLVLHNSQLHCVHNGIQKVKSEQNVMRYQLGLPGFGRLKSKVEDCLDKPGFITLTLILTYNGDNL